VRLRWGPGSRGRRGGGVGGPGGGRRGLREERRDEGGVVSSGPQALRQALAPLAERQEMLRELEEIEAECARALANGPSSCASVNGPPLPGSHAGTPPPGTAGAPAKESGKVPAEAGHETEHGIEHETEHGIEHETEDGTEHGTGEDLPALEEELVLEHNHRAEATERKRGWWSTGETDKAADTPAYSDTCGLAVHPDGTQ